MVFITSASLLVISLVALLLIFVVVPFVIITYYHPYIGLLLGSLGFMFVTCGWLFLIRFFRGVGIGQETFYIACFLALITVALPHLAAFGVNRGGNPLIMVVLASLITFILAWGVLIYGYYWEVSDVLAKYCPTCSNLKGSRPVNALAQCIIWDNSLKTTQCLYPSIVGKITFISTALAMISLVLAAWYCEEVEIEEITHESH